MAFDDTLFQLGMDLTRSSTAQKEEFGETAQVAGNSQATSEDVAVSEPLAASLSSPVLETLPEVGTSDLSQTLDERNDFFIERDGVRYAGNHLIIDLFGARKLDDLDHVETTLRRCVDVAGASLLHIHLHHFTPNGGVSGVAVLSESHISIHSWPEADYAALDVFMCGDAKPELCIGILKDAFEADSVVVKTHQRGEELDLMSWKAASSKAAPDRQIKAA